MDYESTPEFDAQFLKLTKKNKMLKERFLKKISQILDNPFMALRCLIWVNDFTTETQRKI